MNLEKAKYKLRCEFGACKEMAVFTIRLNRVGIKSRIHVCEKCLNDLAALIEKTLAPKSEMVVVADVALVAAKPPKSIETLKPKKGSRVSESTIKE